LETAKQEGVDGRGGPRRFRGHDGLRQGQGHKGAKVFCFFFSKKKLFLLLILARSARKKMDCFGRFAASQ